MKKRPTEEEQELLDIFLEEAREVLATIRSKLEACQAHPDDHESLVTIRRGFHTLKGSGRMVGLTDLGEVAWSVERALNKWLQETNRPRPGYCNSSTRPCSLSTAGWRYSVNKVSRTSRQLNWWQPHNRSRMALILQRRPPDFDTGTLACSRNRIRTPEEAVSGETQMSPALFDIASTEARQNVAILRQQFEELRTAASPVVHYDFMRAAHTLAGVNRTMGFAAVAELATALEGWLEARVDQVFSLSDSQVHMLDQAIAALDGMVQSIAEQQIPEMHSELADQLIG